MYEQLESMQTAVDNVQSIPVFGYKDAALDTDAGIPGHNTYSDLNDNNIPLTDGTGLSLQETEKGFRNSISSLSRSFFTHFFGRSSFNTNKLKELMNLMLGTYKADYTHNFRAWDSTAVYAEDDVCFLVANGIRYCFKSLADDNTSAVSASADGVLSYDSTKWLLLTEQRTVRHPIGKPFLWFSSTVPSDSYICFSDGGRYNWASYPKLNTPEFRALLSRYTYWGARANDIDFTVPSISELYPISSADMQNTSSVIGAKVPEHHHALSTVTVSTNATLSTDHSHLVSAGGAGSHGHYTGDYSPPGGHRPDISKSWHEDSKFYGGYEDRYENSRVVWLTPSLAATTFTGAHTVTMGTATYSHTHPDMSVASSSGIEFLPASDKYRPGTIKASLVVRAN